MNPDQFKTELAKHNLCLSDKQMQQYAMYYDLLIETNKNLNLTAITQKEEVYLKHFYDSIALALYSEKFNFDKQKVIDVGTGAGFPSIPIKIAYENLQFTLLDALNKRIDFLKTVTEKLNLQDVELIHGRAEDFGHDENYRACFDFATARAVAKTSVLAEYTLPFIKKDGYLLAMKGSKSQEELSEAENALKLLGGVIEENYEFNLPNGDYRSIQVIRKAQETPDKYPRKAGKVTKKPL